MDTSALAKREIPIFKGEGRDYIDSLVCIGGVSD